MAIKMRVLKVNEAADCVSCGCSKDKSLDMFEVAVGPVRFKICDVCADRLFYKALSAVNYTNARIKSPRDTRIKCDRYWAERNKTEKQKAAAAAAKENQKG